ncbi:MAG: hypothetical protein AAGA32_13515 [Pseudomonadota bacterium]
MPQLLAGNPAIAGPVASSQESFLSGIGGDTPVQSVLLRRVRPGESEEAHAAGLDIVAQCLGQDGPTLYALTQMAAEALSGRVARPVETLPPLPRPMGPRLDAIWQLEEARIHVPSTGAQFDDDALHWRRLRDRATLQAARSAPLDAQDVTEYMAAEAEPAPSETGPIRVLAVVPNGVGLGHLTRLLAIVDRLSARMELEAEFWCHSQAAGLIEDAGHPVQIRPTAAALGADPALWALWEASALGAYLAAHDVAAVLHDAARVPPWLAAALRAPGAGRARLVLVRRAMWQPGQNLDALETAQHAELVLEPGELAGARDSGATKGEHAPSGLARTVQTAPVVLSRAAARTAQAWRPFRRPQCLVNLGAETFADHAALSRMIRSAAQERGVRLTWLVSPLAAPPDWAEAHVTLLETYPVAPALGGYDGIITAAGYNSYHEALLLTDVPVLFAPRQAAALDDQAARAAHAAAEGWADTISAASPDAAQTTLMRFLERVSSRAKAPRPDRGRDGADEMAEEIQRLLTG